MISSHFKKGLIHALYEYLLVITPVGIYVALEAKQKSSWNFFFISPEWAIATIFLSFVGIASYRKEVESTGKKVLNSFLGILGISNVLIVVSAVINSSTSLKNILNHSPDPAGAIHFRGILFIVVSILFFIAVGGSRAYKLKQTSQ